MLVAFMAPLSGTARDSSTKISLMAETLRARDAGDLVTAKEKAEELIKIAPDDENVQRLNASINSEIERQAGSSAEVIEASDEPVESPLKLPHLLKKTRYLPLNLRCQKLKNWRISELMQMRQAC